MIRTLNGHEQDGLTTYMIVGRLEEIASAHVTVGRTRIVVHSELTGLTIGEMVTVCAHRDGDQYVADTIAHGLPPRRPSELAG